MKSKELRAKRFKLIEDARALINVDNPTAEQTAKFDEMMSEADKLKAQIDRIERAEELASAENEQLRATSDRSGVSEDEAKAHKDAITSTFNAWLKSGTAGLNQAQMKIYDQRFMAALSEGTTTAGGFTVPQGFFDRMDDAQKAYGGMIDVSYVFDTATGNALPIPTDNDTTNAGSILSENTQAASSGADPTFGSVTLNAYVYTSKIVLVSNQLLQDSAFDLDAFLSNKLGVRIARATNTHFTVGTGTGQPNGAVTAAQTGVTLPTGNTTTITYNGLIDLEHSVDPAYRKGALFMMSDAALKSVKKLVDSQNRPLWLAGLAVKEPDTINGYPYTINQDIAVPAANAKSVLFGDFSRYYIRRVAGAQMMRLTERYADFNQTGFVAFQRFDGNLVDAGTHPLSVLVQSAT